MATIYVTREPNEDATAVAAKAASEAGTKIAGNLRWYGHLHPAYREVSTADGRTVRVEEPTQGTLMPTCELCSKPTEQHDLYECTCCKRNCCGACLYTPSVNVSHCSLCHQQKAWSPPEEMG